MRPRDLITCNYLARFYGIKGPISTKLGTHHPWVNRILVYSNQGPYHFPKADNRKKFVQMNGHVLLQEMMHVTLLCLLVWTLHLKTKRYK